MVYQAMAQALVSTSKAEASKSDPLWDWLLQNIPELAHRHQE
jgi:hypothetical protein